MESSERDVGCAGVDEMRQDGFSRVCVGVRERTRWNRLSLS